MRLKIKERLGTVRTKEPISFGVPFEKGILKEPDSLSIEFEKRKLLFDSCVLSRWNDESVKWLLIDSQIDLKANAEIQLRINQKGKRQPRLFDDSFKITENENSIIIQNGSETFYKIRKTGAFEIFGYYPATENKNEGNLSTIELMTDTGENVYPCVSSIKVEYDNRIRKTLNIDGYFGDTSTFIGIEFSCRILFFYGKQYLKAEFTIINRRSAEHVDGAWDLGDRNSFYFKDLSWKFKHEKTGNVLYSENVLQTSELMQSTSDVSIYQGSSGKPNWKSKNHVNKDSNIPIRVDGYTIFSGNKLSIKKKSQANPIVCKKYQKTVYFCYLDKFWQNFPKNLASKGNQITIGLFPEEFEDLFELQPGEQKTHSFYFGCTDLKDISNFARSLASPLVPQYDCKKIFHTLLRPKPVPLDAIEKEQCIIKKYSSYTNNVIKGVNSFYSKNIIIDEFGWRNFGDIFADHESAFNKGNEEFISHYNNQYDVIKGLIFQYLRTGDQRWFDLSINMADHVCDIDIYHTDQDKYQYNYGLFWHTDHHLEAYTCTHRTVSKRHRSLKSKGAFGGGPYVEHNYATGFLYLYWLTGNEKYKHAVLELSSFVINWLKGPDTFVETLFQKFRKSVKSIKALKGRLYDEIYVFNGPGRASGNSLNTLLDGFLLTEDKIYLMHAENLILQAVHPDDDQNSMNLLNAEIRWFYTVFLQALCRYLDVKKSMDQLDDYFEYARQVLVNYALWMAENEYPYLEKPEILEFPNETWAAQDVRKADIFAIASEYVSGDFIDLLKERSHFFFKHAIEELDSFETRFYTRPMVLLLTNGMPYFEMLYKDSKAMAESKYNSNFSLNSTSKNVLPKRHRIKIEKKLSLRREAKWLKMQIKSRI